MARLVVKIFAWLDLFCFRVRVFVPASAGGIRMKMILTLAIASVVSMSARAQEWDCYAPMPGHPTAEERIAFIREIADYAVGAERKYGVPAPAIAAMAINESGYGFTRTALNANNLFGYKWRSAVSAGNRGAWELECQPAWDEGNRYIRFADRADAVDFVASRLATSVYYRADTEAFGAAMSRGDDRSKAIASWVDAIADPYNYKPQLYARSIKQLMNNALDPSDILSASDNLYRLTVLSETSAMGTAMPKNVGANAVANADHVAAVGKAQKAAYAVRSTNGCLALDTDVIGWPARFVRECVYPAGTDRTGYVLLVDVKPEAIATWIETSCTQLLPNVGTCFSTVLECAKINSGMMFPIGGNMMEDMDNSPWKNYFFRNGMTVSIRGQPNGQTDQIPLDRQKELARISDTAITRIPSGSTRFWRTLPRQFAERFPGEGAPASLATSTDMQRWLDLVRAEFQKALESPNNRLLEAWVAAHPQTLAAGRCPRDDES